MADGIGEISDKSLASGQLLKVKMYQGFLKRVAKGEQLSVAELKEFRKLEGDLNKFREQPDAPADAPEIFGTMQEVADYAEVTKRTISYHVNKSKKIKMEPDGTFQRKNVDKWLEGGGGQHTKRNKKTTHEKIKQEELKYRKWKAKREELIVKQLQESLVPVDDMISAFEARAYELARSLIVMSRRIGHRVASEGSKEYKAVLVVIDEEVRRMMDSYSRPLDI